MAEENEHRQWLSQCLWPYCRTFRIALETAISSLGSVIADDAMDIWPLLTYNFFIIAFALYLHSVNILFWATSAHRVGFRSRVCVCAMNASFHFSCGLVIGWKTFLFNSVRIVIISMHVFPPSICTRTSTFYRYCINVRQCSDNNLDWICNANIGHRCFEQQAAGNNERKKNSIVSMEIYI